MAAVAVRAKSDARRGTRSRPPRGDTVPAAAQNQQTTSGRYGICQVLRATGPTLQPATRMTRIEGAPSIRGAAPTERCSPGTHASHMTCRIINHEEH